MSVLRTREDFDRYQSAFHRGDYETAFEYYVDQPQLSVFGVRITTPSQLHKLYRFLKDYVRETVMVERFAISNELIAVETVVRVKGLRDLDHDRLREHGLYQFHAIGPGECQSMRHFVLYRLRDGKIESGCCVASPA
jgi:hypothetical protein